MFTIKHNKTPYKYHLIDIVNADLLMRLWHHKKAYHLPLRVKKCGVEIEFFATPFGVTSQIIQPKWLEQQQNKLNKKLDNGGKMPYIQKHTQPKN